MGEAQRVVFHVVCEKENVLEEEVRTYGIDEDAGGDRHSQQQTQS